MQQKLNIRILVYAAVLVAMDVVLTRLVAIPIGPTIRLTVGNVPIILAGLWLGPVIGGICGGTGDIIGCLVAGYAPNPLILVSSILTGIIPGLVRRFLTRDISTIRSGGLFGRGFLKTMLVLALMGLVTSQGFTTWGLSLLQGMPFWALFISRIPQTILLTIVDSILVVLLYASPVTNMVTSGLHMRKSSPTGI